MCDRTLASQSSFWCNQWLTPPSSAVRRSWEFGGQVIYGGEHHCWDVMFESIAFGRIFWADTVQKLAVLIYGTHLSDTSLGPQMPTGWSKSWSGLTWVSGHTHLSSQVEWPQPNLRRGLPHTSHSLMFTVDKRERAKKGSHEHIITLHASGLVCGCRGCPLFLVHRILMTKLISPCAGG